MQPSAAVEQRVSTRHGYLHAKDHPGHGTPFVFLHGYPDDSTVYDKLIAQLHPHRSVSFDFLGYGQSERVRNSPVADGQRLAETEAVIDQLGLGKVILVGHDAGGPVAVEYALAHPDRVERLVLFNCYFGESPTLRFPEMIRLMGDPDLVPLTDALFADLAQRQWLLGYTATRFGYGPADDIRDRVIVPVFFGSEGQPDALDAIRAWTARLFTDLAITSELVATGKTGDLQIPVDIIFGANDPYLNSGVAEHLAGLFPNARLRSVQARHWLQWDEPEAVARLLIHDE
ncbi:alpha/beta hydrolase [Streptomyces sp. NPDC086777]|uniref:alpha/beta fold hydrolase n=1 Tax=Streptomyces sp. NPDC086777 TaxID=3154866 RepID=UPI00344C0C83